MHDVACVVVVYVVLNHMMKDDNIQQDRHAVSLKVVLNLSKCSVNSAIAGVCHSGCCGVVAIVMMPNGRFHGPKCYIMAVNGRWCQSQASLLTQVDQKVAPQQCSMTASCPTHHTCAMLLICHCSDTDVP